MATAGLGEKSDARTGPPHFLPEPTLTLPPNPTLAAREGVSFAETDAPALTETEEGGAAMVLVVVVATANG